MRLMRWWPLRAGWKARAAAIVPLALIALLIGADRLAARYTQGQIAQRIERYGFPARPAVTVEGFPFLTQLIRGRLDSVDISASRMRLGPVQASIRAHAAGIVLGSGGAGTISRLTATGLIPYSAIAKLAGGTGLPRLTVTADGRHEVKLRTSLSFVTVTAYASLSVVPPDGLEIHILSAPGIPGFLLARIRTIPLHLPPLPLGLAVRGVGIGRRGVLIHAQGANLSFGQRG